MPNQEKPQDFELIEIINSNDEYKNCPFKTKNTLFLNKYYKIKKNHILVLSKMCKNVSIFFFRGF